MTRTFIGVDGGGTQARAVLVDAEGTELTRHTGGAGIVDPRDPARAADVVALVARHVLANAGIDEPATALCCGLAGAGREQEREAVRVALMLAGVAERVVVIGDAEAAMANAFVASPGVLLVAGTGSIAWARGDDGAVVRIGGWGTLLGDEGSGYNIGLLALQSVARADDGRDAPTALTGAVLEAVSVAQPGDLIAWAASASKRDIAALAPIVFRCADDGDAAAAAIRSGAVAQLVSLAVAAAQRTRQARPDIALAGGLIAPGGPLHDTLRAAVAQALPDARVLQRPIDAALGAAVIARATQ